MSLLEVKNVVKKYGRKKVVNDISFEVKAGEIFGILGPNGAGKTTTLEMIETLRRPDAGTILLDGVEVAKDPDKIKRMIGVQMQTTLLYDKLTLTEQLDFLISIYGVSGITSEKLLKKVDLLEKANSYPEHLSGGQHQRFGIAAALVNKPKIIFLDEPTTGLDPQARRNMWDLIKDFKKDGITVMLTTHYMEEASLLCDRIAIMDEGKIVALDKPRKLIQQLLDSGFKKEIEVQQADLEDVFINLTGKELRE